jgi:hypothetical protein
VHDYREEVYATIRFYSAAKYGQIQELQTMKILASCHPHLQYTVHMLDIFGIRGPNGDHECLVYDLLGPDILNTIDTHSFTSPSALVYIPIPY